MIDINLGVAPDPRTEEQKAKDWKHKDFAGSITLNWKEKPESEWKKYVPRDQAGSLSCVAQTVAKAVETLIGIVLSAHPIYRWRANFPSGGMWPPNAGEIFKKLGTTTEALDPSQYLGETKMNRDVTVETPFKIDGYAFPDYKSIDEIAEAIEMHKHCALLIRCNRFEWTAKPKFNGANVNFHHEICGVDYFLKDGVKTILIEDSTGHFNSFDGKGRRLLSEDFLMKRLDHAMYLIKNLAEVPYVFTLTLRIGSKGREVKMLQAKLKIAVDGIFGPKTKEAVVKFQKSNGLVDDGIVGPKTRAILNQVI